MRYAISEIIIPLLLSLGLGLLIGWFLWGWRRTKVSWSEYESLKSGASGGGGDSAKLQAELDACGKQVAKLESELADAKASGPSGVNTLVGGAAGATAAAGASTSGGAKAGASKAGASTDGGSKGADGDAAKVRSLKADGGAEASTDAGGDEAGPYGAGSLAGGDGRTVPDGFPIKGNIDSMLYHRPDSRNYGATVAEVWFDTADRAEAADFKLASTHPKSDGAAGSASAKKEPSGPYGDGSRAPGDGRTVPDGFPIKGNADSMLYHRPDSRNYGATVAEVWFDTADRAETAGFALAPTHPKGDGDAGSASKEPAGPFGEGSRAPGDGRTVPEGFPIKGNADSMLYHRPDSRNYGATVAEVWFDTADRAETAGFKLAPTHPKK